MAGEKVKRSVGSWVVISAFLASGIFHLVNPSGFLFLLPDWAPEPILLIYLSGVAEIIAAVGLLLRQKWAPIFTALVLLAVWPANWWFAIDALSTNPDIALAAWLRLPLQIPLIWFALKSPVRA
ncbi:MAG: DoxX family protein [Actinobacteria bacterium]|uniref:Unannotated protein n=1 Tax=freshwater metagenome TaxID=449393 RepID=A0A6J6CD32_9ZZZZ|nr:DoxX family protein [Actinomycetota bacterium]